MAGLVYTAALLLGTNSSPAIRTVTACRPLAIVKESPTDVPVSVRNSVFTSASRTAGDEAYHLPAISAIPDHPGSPWP